ncbi:DUF1775 domain-containing protein [Geodermatophilus sp. URMC 64]
MRPRRAVPTVLLGLALLLLGAGPALAHVEATAGDGAQAGDGPVTITFSAEAESDAAGIARVATQLPEGVLPEWVSLASGPPGWALTGTDDGFEITGPALPTGTDAEYAVTIATLPPDLTELVLPTIVSYGDGSEDAWIEPTTAANPNPGFPAPVVTVAAAAATSAPASTTSASAAPATTAAPSDTAAAAADDGGSNTAVVLTVVVLALAVVGAGLWFWRSRAARRG